MSDRWMGPVRFTIGALHEVLQRKKYAAHVAFLPAAAVGSQSPSGKQASTHTPSAAPEETRKATSKKQEGKKQQGGPALSSSASHGPATKLLDALGDLANLPLSSTDSLPQVSSGKSHVIQKNNWDMLAAIQECLSVVPTFHKPPGVIHDA